MKKVCNYFNIVVCFYYYYYNNESSASTLTHMEQTDLANLAL